MALVPSPAQNAPAPGGSTPPSLAAGCFAAAARRLAGAARRLGLVVPGFQSPPRTPGLLRAIQHDPVTGDCVVLVRLDGRLPVPVLGDVIDGILACNDLPSASASAARECLWEAVGDLMARFTEAPAPELETVRASRASAVQHSQPEHSQRPGRMAACPSPEPDGLASDAAGRLANAA